VIFLPGVCQKLPFPTLAEFVVFKMRLFFTW
jgi:hypothetical protein